MAIEGEINLIRKLKLSDFMRIYHGPDERVPADILSNARSFIPRNDTEKTLVKYCASHEGGCGCVCLWVHLYCYSLLGCNSEGMLVYSEATAAEQMLWSYSREYKQRVLSGYPPEYSPMEKEFVYLGELKKTFLPLFRFDGKSYESELREVKGTIDELRVRFGKGAPYTHSCVGVDGGKIVANYGYDLRGDNGRDLRKVILFERMKNGEDFFLDEHPAKDQYHRLFVDFDRPLSESDLGTICGVIRNILPGVNLSITKNSAASKYHVLTNFWVHHGRLHPILRLLSAAVYDRVDMKIDKPEWDALFDSGAKSLRSVYSCKRDGDVIFRNYHYPLSLGPTVTENLKVFADVVCEHSLYNKSACLQHEFTGLFFAGDKNLWKHRELTQLVRSFLEEKGVVGEQVSHCIRAAKMAYGYQLDSVDHDRARLLSFIIKSGIVTENQEAWDEAASRVLGKEGPDGEFFQFLHSAISEAEEEGKVAKIPAGGVEGKYELKTYAEEFVAEHEEYSVSRVDEKGHVILRRLASSFCKSCNRVHDSEGGKIKPVRFGREVMVVFSCFRRGAHGGKLLVIAKVGECGQATEVEQAQLSTEEEFLESQVAKFNSYRKPDDCHVATEDTVNMLPGKYLESESIRKLMADNEIVAVRAPMGIGKTHATIDYIKEEGIESYVAISFRKSFTDEKVTEFPSARDYREFEGKYIPSSANRLVIQYESLHKINPQHYHRPQLLVLDEVESIIDQQQNRSNFMNHIVFDWLVRFSKKVVVSDATLTNRAIDQLKVIRKVDTVPVVNFYSPVYKDKEFILYPNASTLVDRAIKSAGEKKVAIVTDNKKMAKVAAKAACSEVRDKKVLLVTKESRENFNDMSDEIMRTRGYNTRKEAESELIKGHDIFCHTPTIQAGCSFEGTGIDTIYACFEGTINERAAIQMLGRIRGASKFHIYISPRRNSFPESEEEIKEGLEKVEDWKGDNSHLVEAFTSEGRPQFRRDDRFRLFVNSLSYANKSRNNFALRFAKWIRYYGGTFTTFTGGNTVASERLREYRKNVTAEDLEAIIAAPLITYEQYSALVDGQTSRTEAELNAMKKYNMVSCYKISEQNLTAEFLKRYQSSDSRNIFTRVNMIARHGSMADYQGVLKRHIYIHTTDEDKIADLYENNRADISAIVAIDLVGLLGFDLGTSDLCQEIGYEKSELRRLFTSSVSAYVDRFKRKLQILTGCKMLDRSFGRWKFEEQKHFISELLRRNLGLSIVKKTRKKDEINYVIVFTDKFSRKEDSYVPSILLP